MLKKDKNVLYKALVASGQNPDDFVATETLGTFEIALRGSPLRFTVKLHVQRPLLFSYDYIYPGPILNFRSLSYSAVKGVGIRELAKQFRSWLTTAVVEYQEEQARPDLWGNLRDFERFPGGLENTPFSADQLRRIEDSLQGLYHRAQSMASFSPEALAQLSSRIDYLIDASKRLGAKDWLLAAMGALVSFATEAALTSPMAKEFLAAASDSLRWILHTAPLLP